MLTLSLLAGCGGNQATRKDEFFTSGSQEADQRASQRMAKSQQLADSGDSKDKAKERKAGTGKPGEPVQVEGKRTLFERLGGEKGITAIVEDFAPRAMEDPRVNWQRQGVNRGGWFHRARQQGNQWKPTPENVAKLKKHLVQFLSLSTGGPAQYDGRDIKLTHAAMHISNPEFDAAVGDLKASLDRLQIADKEQKELLAIVESTRPEIVTQR